MPTSVVRMVPPPAVDVSAPPTIVAELLTTAEAAALLNVGERTLWRWSRSGQAPRPVKIGGVVRYRRGEYMAWIADGCPDCRQWTYSMQNASRAV